MITGNSNSSPHMSFLKRLLEARYLLIALAGLITLVLLFLVGVALLILFPLSPPVKDVLDGLAILLGIFLALVLSAVFLVVYREIAETREVEQEKKLKASRETPEARRALGIRTVDWNAARRWEQIRHTHDISVLEDFIKEFGETVYGGTARTRLMSLKNDRTGKAV